MSLLLLLGGKPEVKPTPGRVVVNCEYPTTDLYFLLRDPNTGAPITRLALDDPDPSNTVSDIRLRGQLPGGKKEAAGTMPRDPRFNWGDLAMYADAEFCGQGREMYWSGRFTKAPKVSGERVSITGVCAGWQSALEDNKAVIGPGFIDSGFGRWQEMSTQRKLELLNSGVITLSPTTATGWQGNGSAKPGITFDFDDISTKGVNWDWGELWYDGGGIPLGALLYHYTRLRGGSGPEWATQGHLVQDDLGVSLDSGTDHHGVSSPDAFDQVTASADDRRYAILRSARLEASGGGATLGDLDNWENPKVLSRLATQNLALQGTWPEVGYTAKQMLEHMVPLIAPPLEVNPELIEDDGYVINQAWFADPSTPAEKVREVCKYSPYFDWFIRRGRLFERRRAGTYGHNWYARNVEFTEEGQDGERLWESILGSFTTSDGRQLTVGPPGSGANVESELLQITDPDHPAVQAPVTRRDLLQFQGVTEPSKAIELCAEFLREANELSRSGQVTLSNFIYDETGTPHPPAALQEGDRVFFPEAFDRSGRKVVDYDYGHGQCSVLASLDAPPEGLQALQERYRAVLIPLGVG